MTEQNGGSPSAEAPTEAHTVTISETTAQILASICRQTAAHDALSKIRIGSAQLELEQALAALHPPEKPIVIPRAARRRAQKITAVKG